MMKKWKLFLLSVVGAFLPILFTSNVGAVDQAGMIKKWVFTQYYECVRSGYINKTITQQKNSGLVANDVFQAQGSLAMPSYNFQNTAGSRKANCKELFLGETSSVFSSSIGVTGVLSYAGINFKNISWNSANRSQEFLENLGYSQEETAGESRFTINAYRSGRYNVGAMWPIQEIPGGSESSTATITAVTSNGSTTYSVKWSDNLFSDLKINIDNRNKTMKLSLDSSLGCRATHENQTRTFTLKDNPQEFFDDVIAALPNITWGLSCTNANNSQDIHTYTFGGDTPIVDAGGTGDYVYAKDKNSYDVSSDAIKRMSGFGISDLAYNNNELYTLYYYYLDKALPSTVKNRMTCNPDSTANLTEVRLKDTDGQVKQCYVNFNGVSPSSITVYTQVNNTRNRQPYPSITTITMQGVIDWLNSVDANTLTDIPTITEQVGIYDPTDAEVTTGGEDGCKTQGKSLGWLLCSALDLAQSATTSLYNGFVKDALQVQPELFQEHSGHNYTREAWGVFQGFANVAFIILLLVVIFSQLTGVGIDNYGIKKILPKLIITAILVNLSYYICVIAVDLSNILGNGLQALFEGIGVPAPSTLTMEGGTISIAGAGITAIGVLGGIAAVGAVIVNPAILLSLLVSAIGILISMLFMFVLLSVRQAAIVVLTVASPIALVCYMLPNTKKVFDIWRKAGVALLMLYPICGLLIGGGNYVSNLLLAVNPNGGFFMALTAMVIGIAPIFFIPMLLKNSFSALGNIGAKISGLGEKVRGGAVRGMRGTDAYKNAQERGAERRTRIRAGVDRDGNARELSGLGKFLRGGSRNVARNRSQYLKNQDAGTRENSLMGVGFDAAVIGQTKRAEKDELANYMTLINDGTRNGDEEEKLMEIYDDYMKKGNKLGAIAAARVAGRRKDTAARFATAQFTSGNINKYSAEMARSIAKEVSTGDNSGIFRSATPMQYQYASDVHSGAVSASTTYEQWKSDQSNVDRTMSAYITKSDELMGVNKKGLSEIAQLAQSGGMSDKEKTRLQNLARETINNRSRIAGWDTTKANEIATIAGWTYDEKTNTFSGEGVANTGSGSTGGNGGAVEGESFNVRGGDNGSGAAPSAPASNPAPVSNPAPAGSPAASPAPSNPPARPVNPLTTPAQSSESAQPSRLQADRTQPGEGPRIQITSEGDFQSFMRDRHS